jgi:hypothetical protein
MDSLQKKLWYTNLLQQMLNRFMHTIITTSTELNPEQLKKLNTICLKIDKILLNKDEEYYRKNIVNTSVLLRNLISDLLSRGNKDLPN